MNLEEKIVPIEKVAAWREQLRGQGRKLVVTNGCFDILHSGHVTYLDAARKHGDALLVGLNSDASVRELKGEGRPLNAGRDRAIVLAGLASVDAVCLFPDRTAMRFLGLVKPDVYVKGGDYDVDTINQVERRFMESIGAQVIIVPGVAGKSTSGLIGKLRSS